MGRRKSDWLFLSIAYIFLVCSWTFYRIWSFERFPRGDLSPVQPKNRTYESDESMLTTTSIERFDDRHTEKCSNGLFQRYIETHGYFPGDGIWNGSQFQPTICKFMPVTLPAEYLRQCVNNSRMLSLATLGDSQARRYFYAIRKHFKSVASPCRQLKAETEGTKPNRAYFAQGNRALKNAFRTQDRACRTCISEVWLCDLYQKDNKTVSIRFEYISMEGMWGHTLSLNKKSWLVKKSKYVFSSFQEYVFKYYFNATKPDVVFIFAPLNHDKKHTKSDVTGAFAKLARVLQENLPSAKIYVIGGTSEFEDKKHEAWKNVRFHGMLATEKIDLLHHVMYDVLKKFYLGAGRQIYGFLDMVKMSGSRLSWSEDGVHFDTPWYQSVTSYLLQLLCNDCVD